MMNEKPSFSIFNVKISNEKEILTVVGAEHKITN